MKTDIKLEKPGSGLPHIEQILLNFLFPFLTLILSKSRALKIYNNSSKQMIQKAENLSEDFLAKPVLIPLITGIEDSSRFWSASMVLAHLIITNTLIKNIILTISNEKRYSEEVDIAEVKPEEIEGKIIINDYKVSMENLYSSIKELPITIQSKMTHKHPWFGELNGHGWLCLAAVHNIIHKRQIQKIIKYGWKK